MSTYAENTLKVNSWKYSRVSVLHQERVFSLDISEEPTQSRHASGVWKKIFLKCREKISGL
jgi:hypothetical protein